MRYFLLLAPIVLALTGCSWERGARIEAGVSQPQFTFTNLGRLVGSHPEEICATDIGLFRGDHAVWRIRAGDLDADEKELHCVPIESVRYGEVPQGFREDVAPEGLQPNILYYLRFDNVGDYPKSGSRAFCLDEDWDVAGTRWQDGYAACDD